MYKFYYDWMLATIGEQIWLYFTDTDSFIYHTESELFTPRSQSHLCQLVGLVKFRTWPTAIFARQFLHSQQIHIRNCRCASGLWFKMYLLMMLTDVKAFCKFHTFPMQNLHVTTCKLRKVCLLCVDDMRDLLPNAIQFLAYGHRDISSSSSLPSFSSQ